MLYDCVMAILITGAAGFIGSHLAKHFMDANHEVILLDRFSDYYSIAFKRRRLEQFLGKRKILEFDLADQSTYKLLDKFDIESVVHLAAQPGVRLSYPLSLNYLRDNVISFANLINWAIGKNIKRVTYASSSSVYGNSPIKPFEENKSSLNPLGFYARSKWMNELIAKDLSDGPNTKMMGLRFFSVYGPWGRPDMAYFRLISAGLSGKEFQLNGDGHKRRDFTYIDDVIESVSRIHFADNYDNGIVNVGGGAPRSILDLIEICERETGTKINIKSVRNSELDVEETQASFDLLTNLVGRRPMTPLEIGIKRTVEWAQSMSQDNHDLNWI
jgi:UDP-glucuronate 4-epimerase